MVKKSQNKNIKHSKEKKGKDKYKETKTTPQKKNKNESRLIRKRFFILLSIIILICIIGFIWILLTPETARAQLIIESGSVQIKQAGEPWISALNGTLLYQSDIVKTGNNSTALIILFKSSIIRLDSNTEIKIQELIDVEGETTVTIHQEAGRTWNTISKISGIDNYEVQTPTTVASVRGTSFDFYILANGNITVSVVNGTVNITTYKEGQVVHSTEVPEYISITVDPDELDDVPEPTSFEEDEWILENQQKDDKFKGDLREELYKRIKPFIPELQKLYNVTEQEIYVLIDGYIDGYFDLPPDTPEWARKLFEFA